MAKASFFTRIGGVLGYIGGGGWSPTGGSEGVAPFNMVGSDAGVNVDAGGALQLAAGWACVRLISETVGSLPLVLKAPDANGKLVPQTQSVTYRMLRYSPNSTMTSVEFWEMMTASLCLWGNAYAEKIRVAGRVVSLEPLRPEYMTVKRDAAGAIRYLYRKGTESREYTADEILHIKGFGVDGLIGLSPVAMARQTFGRAIATDQASGRVYKQGLSAGGFIKYEKSFATQEIRDAVRDRLQEFSGSPNVGKTMVLENGMEYTPITMPPKDAQLLESRMFNVEEVCRWYAVPPQLIGHISKASSWASSLENTILWFLKTCLRAYLTRIEQAVTKSLGLPAGSVLKFNLDALERGDSAARAALYAAYSQNGLRTRNELRDLDDMDAIEGGDELTVQSNLVPLGMLGDVATAKQQQPQPPTDPAAEPPK